ncbi:hypothetical protein CEXT_2941 [Caerostris extrusa]|uniref:Uncharacterized protein n=1 Tax=Caerostris extrusa TaxID=172846 RepID=A0AAV4MGJ9_CAEEX|nr:hypothetical protein CEXT_2941 [Caerostris extrusa]
MADYILLSLGKLNLANSSLLTVNVYSMLFQSFNTDLAFPQCSFLLTYTVGTFFWMFVEGLYLYMLVVKTFPPHRDPVRATSNQHHWMG